MYDLLLVFSQFQQAYCTVLRHRYMFVRKWENFHMPQIFLTFQILNNIYVRKLETWTDWMVLWYAT